MKAWAEKRKREMELVGEKDLADLFQLVIKMCELEEKLQSERDPSTPLGCLKREDSLAA